MNLVLQLTRIHLLLKIHFLKIKKLKRVGVPDGGTLPTYQDVTRIASTVENLTEEGSLVYFSVFQFKFDTLNYYFLYQILIENR